jgi:hypothetical protein
MMVGHTWWVGGLVVVCVWGRSGFGFASFFIIHSHLQQLPFLFITSVVHRVRSFFDKQTRNIMIVGTVFNANLKLFSVIEFNIHLNAAGLLSSSTNISSVRVDSFVGARDWFRLGVEIVVVVIMLYHSWSEFVTAITVGFSNYMNFWNGKR